MDFIKHPIFFALLVPVLAACGGGGGGGSVGMAETGSTPDSTTSTALADDIQAQGFQTAATALPKYGSVTQSSNVDSNGRTTDQASVAFDGTTAEITVTQADGSTFTFDSSDDAWRSGTIDPAQPQVPPGQTDVRHSNHVHDNTGSLFFASYIERGWGDADNWYARGYWIRGGSNPYLQKVEVELGVYIDSPEIDPASPPTLPIAGSATYTGNATGMYYQDSVDGSREIGQYVGDMTLNVDFSTGQLDYCTGCTRLTQLYGHYIPAEGEPTRFAGVTNIVYRATAEIREDGSFETQNVELTWPDDNSGSLATFNRGSLGGIFSNIPDSDGNPRAVMGTAGGEYEYAGRGSGAWVGSFLGTTK